jgi:D-arginine dehydrogenase
MSTQFDYIVVGAGMAGASVAANLASHGRVAVLEAEEHAGYHTTGRSAALFSEIYGNRIIRALSRASRAFFFEPPREFAPTALVSPRSALHFVSDERLAALDAFRADEDVRSGTVALTAAQARELVPVFRAGYLGGAALEPGSADIEVDVLHQGFLRQARGAGAQIHLNCAATRIQQTDGQWTVTTANGSFSAPVLVNAAGAWGDRLAAMANVAPVGLLPMRRTAILIDTPDNLASQAWPVAIDIDGQFYFKPDAGLLLLSPADEHLSEPCDAQPEELDVAIAIDRFEQATGATIKRVKHQWAGLRVFSPDRTPVVGFDSSAKGFFWLVGQGGYGIQTAPALGRLAAALAQGQQVPADLVAAGVEAAPLSPSRFAR